MRASKRAVLTVAAVLAAIAALTGCESLRPGSGGTYEPAGEPAAEPGKILLQLDPETLELKLVSPEAGRPCTLCSRELAEKYGPRCERAREANVNICLGLVDATVQDLNQVTLAKSSKNPVCITIASQTIGGTDVATQLCLCQPTDPPGACPAPVWVQ